MSKPIDDTKKIVDQIWKQKGTSRVRKIRSSMQNRDISPQPFVKIKAKQDLGGNFQNIIIYRNNVCIK